MFLNAAWRYVEIVIGNVEDEVELFEDFAAEHAHFLRSDGSGKEACGHVGDSGFAKRKLRQDAFFHFDRVSKRILQAGFFGDLDFSVYASVGRESVVQQNPAGVTGMEQKFVGIAFPVNQAIALHQQLAVLVFDFQAFVLPRFARELFVQHDAALIEVYFNNPVLKQVEAKLPVSIFPGVFVFPDGDVVALQLANANLISFAEARIRFAAPGLHLRSFRELDAFRFSHRVFGQSHIRSRRMQHQVQRVCVVERYTDNQVVLIGQRKRNTDRAIPRLCGAKSLIRTAGEKQVSEHDDGDQLM